MSNLFPSKLVLAACLCAVAMAAWPAPYPERSVTIVSAFPPGGIVDNIARRIAQRFSERLGQPFVVENRTGAAGSIGYAYAARAQPDGYTLVVASGPTTMAPPEGSGPQGFQPLTAFSAIGMIGTIPQAIVASTKVPARSVPEFVAYARREAGRVNYGSAGFGTTPFFTMEILKDEQQVAMTHVAYRGQPEVITDLIRGELSVTSVTAPLVLPHVQAGKMKALAVTSKGRLAALPDVPTVYEQGLPNLGISNWFALLGPAKLPPDVVATLAKALNEALAAPEMQASFAEIGLVVQPAPPAETLAFVNGDLARWIALSRRLGRP
jgi:tripartite-type tricarboxylate transporter receptor subunit TctC